MKKFIKDIFTGYDNSTADIGRLLFFIIGVAGIIFQGIDVYFERKFNITAFYGASGAYLAAGCAALWIKRNTEPGVSK